MVKKFNKGITLISLVITIVIMLILAAVSINLLLGDNGLIGKAKYAKEKYNSVEEENKLKEYEAELDKINGSSESNLPENTVDTEVGTIVKTPDGWNNEVNYYSAENGKEVTNVTKVSSIYAVAVGDANTIPVPYGFYYVGGKLNSGVVISDNENDKNKYAGNEKVGKDLQGNQFVWVPCTIDNYKKTNFNSGNADFNRLTQSAEKLQIKKYSGFYVGRYEAGTSNVTLKDGSKIGVKQIDASNWANSSYITSNTTDNSKPTSKANEIPYYHADFDTSYEMAERMYNDSYSVSSGLLTGTEWDVMVNWINNNSEDLSMLTNSNWGNLSDTTLNDCNGKYCTIGSTGAMTSLWLDNTTHTNRQAQYVLLTTGASDATCKKNLYDVAGNLWEWTEEAILNKTSTDYILRSGSFVDAYQNCCEYRLWYTASNPGTNTGFRVALYLK